MSSDLEHSRKTIEAEQAEIARYKEEIHKLKHIIIILRMEVFRRAIAYGGAMRMIIFLISQKIN